MNVLAILSLLGSAKKSAEIYAFAVGGPVSIFGGHFYILNVML